MSDAKLHSDYLELKRSYEDAVDITDTDTKTIVVLNFKSLQLLRIKTLQQELFGLQMKLQFGALDANKYDEGLKTIDTKLQAYGQALRNYETLSTNSLSYVPKGSELFGAPTQLKARNDSTKKQNVWTVMGLQSEGESAEYELTNWQEFLGPGNSTMAGGNYILNKSLAYRELDKDGREARARQSAFLERLYLALFGGVALIAPMLIMTLRPSQTTSLITVSIATILFAMIAAVFASEASGKDVLGATAAYAAVLVVFVGANNGSGS